MFLLLEEDDEEELLELEDELLALLFAASRILCIAYLYSSSARGIEPAP